MITKDIRILVVDDEVGTREVCADFLSESGFELETATNGVEALSLLAKSSFQIILSDIQMPKMDGLTLLKEAKKLYPETEVILMTAYGGLPSAIEALHHGAYDYISKPFSSEFLLNSVRKCIDKIKLKNKLKETQQKMVEQEKLAALGAVSTWFSHRMRNSLSVILMCSHYLLEKTTEAGLNDMKEVVNAVLSKIKILEKMTSDLISFSRKYEIQKCMRNLNSILSEEIESFAMQAQIQKVELIKNLDQSVPDILCDPHVLHEAFENIFVNALQAIKEKEDQKLTVTSKFLVFSPVPGGEGEEGAEEDKILVSIENTGSKITPENMDKIFNPFFTTRENGSGLGLAIASKIIKLHGGRILAESKVKNGVDTTAIVMYFPVSDKGLSGVNAGEDEPIA